MAMPSNRRRFKPHHASLGQCRWTREGPPRKLLCDQRIHLIERNHDVFDELKLIKVR